MKKRDVLNSPRLSELRKYRRKNFRNKIYLLILAFSAVFFLLAYVSRLPSVNTNSVEIIGNKVEDTNAIKLAVNEELAGHYVWFFPKTNIFFYPKSAIKNKLEDSFKRLKNVSLSIKDRKTLTISVDERKAIYTWCGSSLPTNADLSELSSGNKKCYFLDEAGYVFDEAPYFSGDVYFKFYGNFKEQARVPSGQFFYKEIFRKLISFKESLETLNLKPTHMYVMDTGDVKIYLSSTTQRDTTPEIIFKIDSDFQTIVENIDAALSTEPFQTSFKKKYSSLEYIDLRFGNKVYYKFR